MRQKGLYLRPGDTCWSWLTIPQTSAMAYLFEVNEKNIWWDRLFELVAITLTRMNKRCPSQLSIYLEKSYFVEKLHRTAFWIFPPITELKLAFVNLPDDWQPESMNLTEDPFLKSLAVTLMECSYRLSRDEKPDND